MARVGREGKRGHFAGAGTVTFTASTLDSIDGTTATNFNNVVLNKSGGLSLAGIDARIDGTLTFSAGKITTGSQKLILGSAATVAGAASGKYVYGNLRRYIASASSPSVSFPVGDASNYTPADIAFSGMRWYGLDPQKVVVLTEVRNPDLTRVDEVGIAALMPGGGHGIAGSFNLSNVELYAYPAAR